VTSHRYLTAVFCDDIRREEGNKLSLMGIYNGILQVPQFPVTVPKFSVLMSLYCSGPAPPPQSLQFTLFMDDLQLGQVQADMSANSSDIPEDKRIIVSGVIQLFPLQFVSPCLLKARALCDGEELKGGTLSVELVAVPTAP
jgi:hypothetical protein